MRSEECVQIWGAKFNSRRDSVPLELRSSSILIAVGETHGQNVANKKTSTNTLFFTSLKPSLREGKERN